MMWRENLCGEDESSSSTQESSRTSWNFSCAPDACMCAVQKSLKVIQEAVDSSRGAYFEAFCAELQHNVHEDIAVHTLIEFLAILQVCAQ